MKNIKIRDETWRALVQLKLDNQKRSIDETINMILEKLRGDKTCAV
jgi:predicted CopG family antitoxin